MQFTSISNLKVIRSISLTMAKYESILLDHVSKFHTLESSLRSLTWLLPGKFKDAELASEVLSASLNVMGMYQDILLENIVPSNASRKSIPRVPAHTRYTQTWLASDSVYKWVARIVEFIRFVQLVIEMGLQRKASIQTKWRGIVMLEILKAILRVILLKVTCRPLLSSLLPQRPIDLSQPPALTVLPPLGLPESSRTAIPDHLKNNHISTPVHILLAPQSSTSEDPPVDNFLLSKVLATSHITPSLSLVRPFVSLQDFMAESIFILRPLVYACLLSSRRSKYAIATSLGMEMVSRCLRRTPPPSALLERAEYAHRDRDMLWYLLRGSIWESYTRPKLEYFAEKTTTAPLLSLLGALVNDWIPLIDEYYYYTGP
ncbi:hypothetical protein SERLA73DRAFT_173759 [Serpula lacrymans var. lacrymans S7.3]|uniref:Peroxisomal membrane protein PEX16 n=2 Tax=Serpula lacrymans var. lacrymans TaxID=341189 RepID=F8PGP4_SERL3|nr:uncharacterized protein SERLADRAFT_454636 [Serpula lacrymans var. lacrymans S7.9]EGO04388.1 hypothetical protein SERLA73DRAFT_173759 [Serpula lacrymans var. lacrymans S7.3]EGO30290.1 hypothetical protein SERLADRAFT_454636 [Serpula lacrymans var. lacrymans S7.9]